MLNVLRTERSFDIYDKYEDSKAEFQILTFRERQVREYHLYITIIVVYKL